MRIRPESAIDFYKSGHIYQYPDGTQFVYSNFTPRSNRHSDPGLLGDKVVFFGLQGVIKDLLIDKWGKEFFALPAQDIRDRYLRRMNSSLGQGVVKVDHILALHKLGYLPISISALPEGSRVNINVPLFTIHNTHSDFYWLVNYLETALSAELWKMTTSATTAYKFRLLFDHYANLTGGSKEFVPFQGHDFSFRGMSGIEDAAKSGAAHLLSFLGTDTIPAIDYLEDYYYGRTQFIGGSVPATEHSVMCMGERNNEIETIRRIITKVNPTGIVSIVSDTWNFWNVITSTANILREEILARKPNELGFAKVVFRPDSGDPVKIVLGDSGAEPGSPAFKGAIQCLWETFGGAVNSAGFRVLNPRVGLIYGDAINYTRAEDILHGLMLKGFCSSNIVLGIGSYTYQYVTRDTHGFAIKTTFGIVNGEQRNLSKDPITDNGDKKSATGLLCVEQDDEGNFFVIDQCSLEEEPGGLLKLVYSNGIMVRECTLGEIRERLLAN
jgi:nicotinamide phosphoribosyltransferase